MKKRKFLIIAIAIIVVVIALVGCGHQANVTDEGVEVSSENQSDEQRLYTETFAETNLMQLSLIEINEGFLESTDNQRSELLSAYWDILKASMDDYTISEEGIRRFNNIVTDVRGSSASFYTIAEHREDRDPIAWYDGLMYYWLEYAVFCSDLPEEVLYDYLEMTKNLYSDLSHEKVVSLINYLHSLLEESNERL